MLNKLFELLSQVLAFNFFDKEKETLRNACTEVTSEDDSDVCNLGSINLGRIDSLRRIQRRSSTRHDVPHVWYA
jgi:hypothetical protein